MGSSNGRAIRLWLGVLAAWIIVRIGLITLPLPDTAAISVKPAAPGGHRGGSPPIAASTLPAAGDGFSRARFIARFAAAMVPENSPHILTAARLPPIQAADLNGRPAAGLDSIGGAPLRESTARSAPVDQLFAAGGQTADNDASAKTTAKTLPETLPTTAAKKWQIYAFSFWRLSVNNPTGLAAAAQYGGSQSGIAGTYRIGGGENSDLSILARITVTPQNSGDRELAAGLSWQPSRKIPVKLIAEYRARTPARDAAAIYITAAVPDTALPGKFRLNGFGQTGIVQSFPAAGGERTAFLDAGLRAERSLIASRPLTLTAGAGAWAGGQRGSQRLDIGPAVSLAARIGGQTARLNADWRFRIGGNANPGNGPALTLSTGF